MTTLLSRILLSMLLFPLAMLVYFCMFFVLEDALMDDYAFLWTGIGTAFFVMVYWLVLWRRAVRWNSTRVLGTGATGVLCIAVGILLGVVVSEASGIRDESFAIFVAGASAPLLWLVATVLLWRETATERARRVEMASANTVFCEKCGYNLTGLREARCPECGTQYTLDQLLAIQKGERIATSDADEVDIIG